MPVIAQLRGLLTQRVKAIASQMLSVGRALLGHILQSGSRFSVPDTLQSKPVSIQQPQSNDPVLPITAVQKRGKGNSTAQPQPEPQLTQAGSKSQTPARQTRQPAKPVAKAGRKPAKRTSAAKSPK